MNGYGTTTKVVEYTYDVFDRRIAKAVDTTSPFTMTDAAIERYVYDDLNGTNSADGGNAVLDLVDPDGNGATAIALERRQLFGNAVDQILAQEDVTVATTNADRIQWPLVDHLGTVRDLVENDGTLGEHYQYDSFGNVIAGDATITRYLFTSRELDLDTDLQYNRARWYDGSTGRWISQDPLGFKAGDANLSRNVSNNVINIVDPSGLQPPSNDSSSSQPHEPNWVPTLIFYDDDDRLGPPPEGETDIERIERELRNTGLFGSQDDDANGEDFTRYAKYMDAISPMHSARPMPAPSAFPDIVRQFYEANGSRPIHIYIVDHGSPGYQWYDNDSVTDIDWTSVSNYVEAVGLMGCNVGRASEGSHCAAQISRDIQGDVYAALPFVRYSRADGSATPRIWGYNESDQRFHLSDQWRIWRNGNPYIPEPWFPPNTQPPRRK